MKWLWFHTTLIFGGFAAFAASVASAGMYLSQSRQLKSKRLGKYFSRLPSLDRLDRIHFRFLSAGVILLSLGILSGLFWARDMRRFGELLKDPRAILSFLTCLMYWAVLTVRASALRRGQKIATSTILIFLLLVASWASSYTVSSGLHRSF